MVVVYNVACYVSRGNTRVDDTITEAVHQTLYLQLASISILPIDMMSKISETTTNVFLFEIASHGYLARLNRSPVDRVMAILWKTCNAEKFHPAGCHFRTPFCPSGSPKP